MNLVTQRHRVLAAALVVLPLSLGAFAAAAPANAAGHHRTRHQPRAAHLTIVHGIRGLVANVNLDGKRILSSFSPRRTAGPLTLTPGRHRITVFRQGHHHPTLRRTVTLQPAEHATFALGLNRHGRVSGYLYDDALRGASDRSANLVFRDVADAVNDVARVDGHRAGSLAAGRQVRSAVHAGHYDVAVVDRRSGRVVVPTQRIPVANGAVTALYLIGSAQGHDLGWVADSFQPRGVTPRAVQTGNSGLAAPPSLPWFSLGLVAAGFATVIGLAVARRRRVLT